MKNIIRVAIPSPLYQLFDYICEHPVKVGSRVLVPFGRQTLVGFVWQLAEKSECPLHKLKKAIAVIDEQPLLDARLRKLLQWVSQYYHHPQGEVCATALPNLLKKSQPAEIKTEVCWQLSHYGLSVDSAELKKAKKQQALFDYLKKHKEPWSASVLKSEGFSSASIKALADKKIIEKVSRTFSKSSGGHEQAIKLNAAQARAVLKISEGLNQFKSFLLEGVTASGKTEVYLQAIAKAIHGDGQALILVPEIGLTPQTIQRFNNRFGDVCFAMHSGMTDRERLNVWLLARSGVAKVIIGTRSAIFTPFKALKVIIVDEEHDLSFKQQDGLRYSARDVAIVRAQFEKIPVVLGSATPSLESLYNSKNNRYERLELPKRATGVAHAKFHVIDIRQEFLDHGLSQKLLAAIKKHLGNSHQVLLFLNRRGYAPVLICHECGWMGKCQRCDMNLTYHYAKKQLICHHCERIMFQPKTCPDCQSKELIPVGFGTERLEDALKQHFPKTQITRIDRDTTRKKGQLAELLNEAHSGKAQVLIGTQMLAKGHHFPRVTMVGIINIDQGFFSSDFRALERMGQLITQVAGRAGRELSNGEVYLQTHKPDNPLLQTLLKQGYDKFAQTILNERTSCGLPPASHFVLLRAESLKESQPFDFFGQIKQLLSNQKIQVLGPIAAPMAKRAGKYRAQLLLTCKNRKTLHQALNHLTSQVGKLKLSRQVRWSIDVDPLEMF